LRDGSEKKELFYIFNVAGFPLPKDPRSHTTVLVFWFTVLFTSKSKILNEKHFKLKGLTRNTNILRFVEHKALLQKSKVINDLDRQR
jgi:hypothetical protein